MHSNECIVKMELLKSGLKSVLGSQQPGSQPSGAETVERLVERVTSSTLLDDRRDAVRALRALSKKFRLEVGAQGMDVLIGVLESDRNDSEIVGYTLDTLYYVVSADQEEYPDDGKAPDGPDDLGVQFTEIFIKKPENVTLLLSLIEDYEFHVRLPAVKLLTSLLGNQPKELQEVILVNPMGVSRLTDLLSDSREVIRNDALLLLLELTKGNANIQKIVTFENAFDRILSIVAEEGSSDGGIVVEDCLSLLLTLLKNNTSNQNFFKEGSFIQQLAPFFDVAVENVDISEGWSAQKAANIHLMLQVVRTLVSPSNPQQVTSSCQKVIHSCGLLEKLCTLVMATGVPADILAEAINTVSEIIRGHNTNQEYFALVNAPCNPPRPAIVVLLMSMVNDKQPFMLRCSGLYCFQCFLFKNGLGQARIIETLLPTTADASTITAGQLLCSGLFSPDSVSNWFSAVALSHALVDNTTQKEQLLRVQLTTSFDNPPVSLIQQVTTMLQQGAKVQTRLGLLVLLSTWLSGCSLAVTHFLSIPTNIPYLTSQVGLAEGDELECLVQGLCSFLLGICVQFNDDSVHTFSKDALCQLVEKRIGLDTFLDKLGLVSKHESYSQAAQKPQLKYKLPGEVLFDYEFCRLFKSLEGTVVKAVTPKPKDSLLNGPESSLSQSEHALLRRYKDLIRDQDQQINEMQKQINELQVENKKGLAQVEEMNATVQQLRDQNSLFKAHRAQQSAATAATSEPASENYELLVKQIDDLKITIAEKDAIIKQGEIVVENSESVSHDDDAVKSQELQRLNELLEQKENEIIQLHWENNSLQEKLAASETQEVTDASKDTISSLENKIVEIEGVNRRLLEEKVTLEKDMKTELDSLRKEQEDLLVLLTEQDTKLTAYKNRLKELGEKVPEDDDDDALDNEEDEVDINDDV